MKHIGITNGHIIDIDCPWIWKSNSFLEDLNHKRLVTGYGHWDTGGLYRHYPLFVLWVDHSLIYRGPYTRPTPLT